MKLNVVPLVGLLCVTSCTAVEAPGGARLSAAQEDAAARVDDREASEHFASYDPTASVYIERCLGHPDVENDGFGECWRDRINPTEAALDRARKSQRAADEHRAASRALRDAEDRACGGISPHDRDVSPFAHREDIRREIDLPEGAIVLFHQVPGMTAGGLQRIVDCHLARNDALGHQVPWMLYCPLVPRNVTATVTQAPDGLAIRVESSDADGAREVKRRVAALIGL